MNSSRPGASSGVDEEQQSQKGLLYLNRKTLHCYAKPTFHSLSHRLAPVFQ